MAAPSVNVSLRCPACQQRTLVKRGPIMHNGQPVTWLSCKKCNVVGWPL